MTPKTDILRSLDQLTSLVVGKDLAISTNSMETLERITFLIGAVAQQAAEASDLKTSKQAQRKLESLTSLKTLATCLLKEVDWS